MIPNVYPICYSALLKLKWFCTHLLLASLISRESVDVEEAASTNAVLKFREKTLECQQACSWITLVPRYGLQFSCHKSFSCTKHGGSEPCEAAFWKYPYMTLTWLLHPSCHNLIINRDLLGGKLERLVIFWSMSKRFFEITNSNNAILQGKSRKMSKELHCLIPPKMGYLYNVPWQLTHIIANSTAPLALLWEPCAPIGDATATCMFLWSQKSDVVPVEAGQGA